MMNRPVVYQTRSKYSPAIRMYLVVCVIATIGLNLATPLSAVDQLTSGTSSRKAKQKAIASIPFAQLNQATRAKISGVVEKPSIYRRLPLTSIEVDPDYFVFLVRHPEVIINIWQIMGVTKMTADRTGPYSLKTNDGVGAISDVELVYGTNNLHIFYATGTYEGPVLRRKMKGECVLILRTEYLRGPKGKPQTKNSLDVFLKIENATAGLIAKTLNPIVGSTADHNFVESLSFLQRLNETTEKNGVGVQKMADRLNNLTHAVRGDFVRMAGLVYERTGKTTIPASMRQPFNNTGKVPPIRTSAQQRQPNYQSPYQRGYPAGNQSRFTDQPSASTRRPTVGYAQHIQSVRPGLQKSPGRFAPIYHNHPVRSAAYYPGTNQVTYPNQSTYRR